VKPQRIQLKRTKGWRMPANTVKVDRTTKWGNPFKGGKDAAENVRLFRVMLLGRMSSGVGYPLRELRGKNLACWCALGQQCHADVLLELANKDGGTDAH
jgi:hypothetical protein